jgi:hypothetical protein
MNLLLERASYVGSRFCTGEVGKGRLRSTEESCAGVGELAPFSLETSIELAKSKRQIQSRDGASEKVAPPTLESRVYEGRRFYVNI